MSEKIIEVHYEDEMEKSFIDYAMTVIVDRALPDVRDGLKPVQRRILYGMHKLGITSDKPFKKSARIVGNVMGQYHPHGDSSIYDAMVRLAQDFHLNVPLVEGHGNFGSIDGDPAAAMRYTEARLSPVADKLLEDLAYKTVDFRPNYDNTLEEPEVLPAKLPNLLLNGVTGIAVGMSTDIPPHNLREIINATILMLEDEHVTTKKLLSKLKGPDFPTGGIIINKEDLLSLYETGEGKVKVRGKVEIEPSTHGKTNVVITEIPYSYSGNKTKFIQTFIDLMKDRKLDELSDIRDESDRHGIRIVLEVRKDIDVDNLLNKLYKITPLEDSISFKFIAIVDQEPKLLSLKDILYQYISFQKEITTKKYQHLLKRAEERREVLEGLIKATDVIDAIIEMLRGSKNVKQAKLCLMNGEVKDIQFRTKQAKKKAENFNFTERQADAILDMKLQRLIQLEVNQLIQENDSLEKQIKRYEGIVSDEKLLQEEIKSYLLEMRDQYGTKRKTEIIQADEVEYVEEIKEEEIYVLLDEKEYIKAVDSVSMKRSNNESINEYTVVSVLNTEKLVCFTDKGRCMQIKVSDIPLLKMKDKGTPIDILFPLEDEKIISMFSETECLKSSFLFMTAKGMTKIVDGSEFKSTRQVINATKLEEGDRLIVVHPMNDEEMIVCVSEDGQVLKFKTEEIPRQKKTSKGVKGITLSENEKVIGIHLFNDDKESVVIGKFSVPLKEIPLKKRGNKGMSLKKS